MKTSRGIDRAGKFRRVVD